MRAETITIIGLGLIGGSLARALKKARPETKIIAVDPDAANLAFAREKKIVDAVYPKLESAALENTDIVVLATPVDAALIVLSEFAGFNLPPEVIITDVLSTKRTILRAYQNELPRHFSRAVAAHPIAGSEKNGVEYSRADLFQGAQVILCPHENQDKEALAKIQTLWQDLGARVITLPADTHDAVFALTSHLPHLLAYAFMRETINSPLKKEALLFAGTGFRDFTRLAGSDADLWAGISLDNRDALLPLLALYEKELKHLSSLLREGNKEAIKNYFLASEEARALWGKTQTCL